MATAARPTLERFAALAGVVAVLLWVVGIFVQESGDTPGDSATGDEVLAYFSGEENRILAGGFIVMLGALFFFIFVGALRARLLAAEGPTGFVTAIAYGAGVVAAYSMLMLPAPDMAGALSNEDLSGDAALAVTSLSDVFFLGAELTGALLLACVGLLVVRTRALPVWMGWISLLFALWMLIPPIGWAGLLFGVPLWTVAVSVLLYLRPAGGPAGPPATEPLV
jgi:hypothetical protein